MIAFSLDRATKICSSSERKQFRCIIFELNCQCNQFCFRKWIKSFIILAIFVHQRRVTSLWGPSPHDYARASRLLSKKCWSSGEPLATIYPIWPARDLNLTPPAPETNSLRLDQLAGFLESNKTLIFSLMLLGLCNFYVKSHFFKNYSS